MTDSELTRWMMDNFLPLQLEHALTEAGSTGYIQVSGKPPYSQADAKEIIEQMTAMAKNPENGVRRVRMVGEDADGNQTETVLWERGKNG